jgi:hypothetical protein
MPIINRSQSSIGANHQSGPIIQIGPIVEIEFLELADFAGVWQSFMVRPRKPSYIQRIAFSVECIAITDREP